MVRFRISDSPYDGTGRIDVAGLDPLGRLAGDYIKAETTLELSPKGLQ